MTTKEAQEAYNTAKQAAVEAENSWINAVDAATAAQDRLKAAEEAAGITGEELFKQVQDGTITYDKMNAEQRELYKAYLDNEQKQKDLEASTKALEDAKKAETMASYENQLALAKESGNYDEFKKSVVDAFEKGELSAEEARTLMEKSMSEMSTDAQQTFMKDLPDSIKDGLNPNKYETTRKKIGDWFSKTWKDCKNAFKDVGEWFGKVGKIAGEAISNAFKTVINWILEKVENAINAPFKAINKALDIINEIPGVNIKKLDLITVPKLATGGILAKESLFIGGEGGKKEAVLPLEQNTEWMDILADRINNRGNAPTKLVLKVGEREFGEVAIGSINDITRQTGELPLVFA
jgi:polyhydroxyalkanoate synthesis regulator phasin